MGNFTRVDSPRPQCETVNSCGEKKLSQIEKQKESIKKGVEEIHIRIDQLSERLYRILLPLVVENKQEEPIQPLGVVIAQELSEISATTWDAVEKLNYLISRIDI